MILYETKYNASIYLIECVFCVILIRRSATTIPKTSLKMSCVLLIPDFNIPRYSCLSLYLDEMILSFVFSSVIISM